LIVRAKSVDVDVASEKLLQIIIYIFLILLSSKYVIPAPPEGVTVILFV
jgi:hypothetical protein